MLTFQWNGASRVSDPSGSKETSLQQSVTSEVLWSSEVPEPIGTHRLGISVPEGGPGTKWNPTEPLRTPQECTEPLGPVSWRRQLWDGPGASRGAALPDSYPDLTPQRALSVCLLGRRAGLQSQWEGGAVLCVFL
ncbi:hypothetical protein J4Q44_G00072300 [Coregonus suidteri]|uniref:Uncharacterized protein n=1 Tax=Coregonus suidteri TaxID=861788 RepID=A0AAN8M0N8_9TELE